MPADGIELGVQRVKLWGANVPERL